jgi:hypothetical protein
MDEGVEGLEESVVGFVDERIGKLHLDIDVFSHGFERVMGLFIILG